MDAQDSCSLETDGIIVTIQYRRERDDVVLFAPVTEPDTDLPPETLRTALSLACHGEGTYGNFLGLFDGALILSSLLAQVSMTTDQRLYMVMVILGVLLAMQGRFSLGMILLIRKFNKGGLEA